MSSLPINFTYTVTEYVLGVQDWNAAAPLTMDEMVDLGYARQMVSMLSDHYKGGYGAWSEVKGDSFFTLRVHRDLPIVSK